MTKSISAITYHDHTSLIRNAIKKEDYLVKSNRPIVYKDYPDLGNVSLINKKILFSNVPFLHTIKTKIHDGPPPQITLELLSQIFSIAYSITVEKCTSRGETSLRSVPSAGGCYPCEVYIATQSIPGLQSGLYHYSVQNNRLNVLRKANLSSYTKNIFQTKNSIPGLVFFITTIFHRSTYKYRERAYRYILLDVGHLIENLSLTLKAFQIPFQCDYDFDDAKANYLLGIDDNIEVCMGTFQIFEKDTYSIENTLQNTRKIEELPMTMKKNGDVGSEIGFSVIREIHSVSSQVLHYKEGLQEMSSHVGLKPIKWYKNLELKKYPNSMSFVNAVLKRRSKRSFANSMLSRDKFESLLEVLFVNDVLVGDLECKPE